MLSKLKEKLTPHTILIITLSIITLGTLYNGFNNCRRYDYAVMFSENTVATLQQIKAERWEIINARWAMDGRGAWNYEFIVRRKAPVFGSLARKRSANRIVLQPRPQAKPAQAPAPKQEEKKKKQL